MIHFSRIPYSMRILLTYQCNLNCSFCLINASDRTNAGELNTEEWLNFFERLKELRVFNISLSGGEVFLRDDIFVLLKKLRENRMHKISILTNGTMISGKVASQLDRLDVKFISISLDGMESTHDQIRGRGAFKETVKGIRWLLEVGIKPTLSFTPTRGNYKDLKALIDFLVSLGIKKIRVNTLSPEGRCRAIYRELALNYPVQVKAVMDVIKEKQEKFPDIKIECQFGFYYYLPQLYKDFEKDPQKYRIQYLKGGCGAASTSCTITPTGDVVPCEGFLNFKGGNIREKDLYNIWNSSKNFEIIRDLNKISMDQVPFCKDCKYTYLCDGGCRATAYIMYNDLLAPAVLCPFKKGDQLIRERNGK